MENFKGRVIYSRPMSFHTTFRTGGPADLYIRPAKAVFLNYVPRLLQAAREEGIPVFILGRGANILVSDRGIRGIVLDMGEWQGFEIKEYADGESAEASVLSGTYIDPLLKKLAAKSYSGLEFLSGLPSSVGGAVWMNARCYEKSISDVLIKTEALDEGLNHLIIYTRESDFSYKMSPFQGKNMLILKAFFKIEKLDKKSGKKSGKKIIRKTMAEYILDRKNKGHYRYPCAGSAFKNNHAFGSPSGKIIDEAGLRGLSIGGAQVAPWHGNIIINRKNASSTDLKKLMDEVAGKVKAERGFELEREVLLVGEWD